MQPVREVYSLLMPVQNGRLVLPRAAISEVMGYTTPKERPEDAPDYLLGFIDWQGQKIPLISFEAACGQPVPELSRRARIAVVFTIGGRLNPNVMAVVTQGYPYLVRVNPGVLLREQLEASDADAPVLARVRMANERPIIPDIEKLESMLADALGINGEPTEAVSAEPVDELEALAGEEEEFEAGFVEADALEVAESGEVDLDTGGDEEAFEMGLLESDEMETAEPLPEFDVEENDTATDGSPDSAIAVEPEAVAYTADYSAELSELEAALGTDDDSVQDEEEITLEGFDLDVGAEEASPVMEREADGEDFDFGDIDLDSIEFGDDEDSPDKT